MSTENTMDTSPTCSNTVNGNSELCGCIIESLMRKSFVSRSFAEKKQILNAGKPTPILNITSKNKSFLRHFQNSVYSQVSWICGCVRFSKLFCWPCLIFCNENNTNVWNRHGFNDLNNLSKARKRHECSQQHIDACVKLKRFGKENRIQNFLSAQYITSIDDYNRNVAANRYILSKFIDVVCFLAKQELPLRGHRELSGSNNRGNYVETLYLLSTSDNLLQTHLEKSNIFTGTCNHIQNDLITSISNVILEEIKTEIRVAKYVSIIVDVSIDSSQKCQMSTIFRYLDESSGNIQERFVGFTDVSTDRSASALFNLIENRLDNYDCKNKLAAQTYDGASVMAGEHNGVQSKVKNICKNAVFVHCYARRLDLTLSQSVSWIRGCEKFFDSLQSFSSFFCRSSRRISALDLKIKKRFPAAAPTEWNYDSSILKMVMDYKLELKVLFSSIIDDGEQWDSDSVVSATGLHSYLYDFSFNFHLQVFHKVFSLSDILFEILQKKIFDISHCVQKINEFLDLLQNERNNFDSFWLSLNEEGLSDIEPRGKRRETSETKIIYNRKYIEIIDVLIRHTQDRFADIENLKFIGLLDVSKFNESTKCFPENYLNCLQKYYGESFDFLKLKSELIYIYSSSEFHLGTLMELNAYFSKNDLKDVLPEVYSLMNLILTIPATCASAESSFSTMKRIETYNRSTAGEDRLSSHSIISIEKTLLLALKEKTTFHDRIIDDFTKNEHRIELKFK